MLSEALPAPPSRRVGADVKEGEGIIKGMGGVVIVEKRCAGRERTFQLVGI